MSIAPKQAALFLIDCSRTMGTPQPFVEGEGDQERTLMRAPLDVMKDYAKGNLARRILRGLTTTPFGAITFPSSTKANNICSRELKERAAKHGKPYDKSTDAYRNYSEDVSMSWALSNGMFDKLDAARVSSSEKLEFGDIHTALILGTQTFKESTFKGAFKKELFLLTDGESPADWEGWEGVARVMNDEQIRLIVVGFDFEDSIIKPDPSTKSPDKVDNEQHLQRFVESLTEPSRIINASQALFELSQPLPKITVSRLTNTKLTLGNPADTDGRSLQMNVQFSKATTEAKLPSMKSTSMQSYKKSGRTKKAPTTDFVPSSQQVQQSQSNNPSTSAQEFSTSQLGKTLHALLEVHGFEGDQESLAPVLPAPSEPRRFVYVPEAKVARSERDRSEEARSESAGREKDDDEAVQAREGEEHGEELKREHEVEEEDKEPMMVPQQLPSEHHLTKGFFYGGEFVKASALEHAIGDLQTGGQSGMSILGFIKKRGVRYDWRLEDSYYVWALPEDRPSEYFFSGLLNAMVEKNRVAVVRFVGSATKGKFPEPKVGLLVPEVINGYDYAYWCAMPLADDIRHLTFNSLSTVTNRKGVELRQHKNLPTKEMDDLMDDIVDSMDLVKPDEVDEYENPISYFDIKDSYNPALHNVQNALIHRLGHPTGELPPVPKILTKYLNPPDAVKERMKPLWKKAKTVFAVKQAPPKPKKISKNANKTAGAAGAMLIAEKLIQDWEADSDAEDDDDEVTPSFATQSPRKPSSTSNKSSLAPCPTKKTIRFDGESSKARKRDDDAQSTDTDGERDDHSVAATDSPMHMEVDSEVNAQEYKPAEEEESMEEDEPDTVSDTSE